MNELRVPTLIFAAACAAGQVFGADRFDKSFLDQHRSAYAGRGFEWENNRIGISERVPIPWSPVKVEDVSITLTHRSLQFGPKSGKALIQQISSLGQPLLSDCVALRLTGTHQP